MKDITLLRCSHCGKIVEIVHGCGTQCQTICCGEPMKELTIKFDTINDVKAFVNSVSKYDFEVDLVSGRYAVDAKSIMGIFSLDLSKPISLEAHTDDASEFFENIKQFTVE